MTASFRRIEVAVAVALLLLGVFAIWQALGMPLGTAAMPGPGVMPLALGILLALSAAALILGSSASEPADTQVVVGHRFVALAFLLLAVTGLVFERAGFVISATLLLFVLLYGLSPLGWWRSLLAAIVASVLARVFFQDVLNVRLPPLPFLP